ncbi:MAG: hypothetical protein HYV09_01120 [Deltaproteobacteria bacterium]|nr:hypothetical protein [Deltaproteobacteria bacterium]
MAYRTPEPKELGPLLGDFRPRNAGRIVASILLLLIGAMVDLGAIVSGQMSWNGWIVVAVWGVVFPAVGLLMLFGRKPDRVRVHELALVSGEGRGEVTTSWTDVVELRTRRHLGGRRQHLSAVLDRHFVRTRDGGVHELRCALVDLEALLELLRARTIEPLLTDARERIDRGETVSFGALSLDADGVRTADGALGWPSIEEVAFEGPAQSVAIKGRAGKWLEAPLDEVPNAHVLRALSRERLAVPVPAG